MAAEKCGLLFFSSCKISLFFLLYLSSSFQYGHSSKEGKVGPEKSNSSPDHVRINISKSLEEVSVNVSDTVKPHPEKTVQISPGKLKKTMNIYKEKHTAKTRASHGAAVNKSFILNHLIKPSRNKDSSVENNIGKCTTTKTEPLWPCKEFNLTKQSVTIVEDRNTLIRWLDEINKTMSCAVVLFYAKWCFFSASIAPVYNAVGRSFKGIPILAIDAYTHNSLNNRYGIVGVPTIVLFHGSRPVARFNRSRTLKDFVEFIHQNTGMKYNTSIEVSSEDYVGPLSSFPSEEQNYYLMASLFYVVCVGMFFLWRFQYIQMLLERLPSWTTAKRVFLRAGREKDE